MQAVAAAARNPIGLLVAQAVLAAVAKVKAAMELAQLELLIAAVAVVEEH
jgi:hypothetical protein